MVSCKITDSGLLNLAGYRAKPCFVYVKWDKISPSIPESTEGRPRESVFLEELGQLHIIGGTQELIGKSVDE